MNHHVFLIGFMGAGKSTVARIVADRLGRPCVDLDHVIEAEAGMPIHQIFAEKGEAAFRAMESAALHALDAAEPSVVACGGGVVLSDDNRATLSRMGYVIYLRVSAGETLARIGADETRPLLAGPGGVLAATKLLDARVSLYAAVASATVDTVDRTPDEVADEVVALVRTEAA